MLKDQAQTFVWNKIKFVSYNFNYKYFIVDRRDVHSLKYSYLYITAMDRFEPFCIPTLGPKYYFSVIKSLFEGFLPPIKHFSFVKRETFFIFLKYISETYQGYRHFVGLPTRGQRTWSNHRSQKKKEFHFFELAKFVFFFKKGNYCSADRKSKVLYAEFINYMWLRHFYNEWKFHKYKRLIYIIRNRYVPWKYDMDGALSHRICVHLKRPPKVYKKRKVKSKKRSDSLSSKNMFNVGFDLFFTKENQKKLFQFFYRKKQFKILKKKKKK